MQNSVLHNYDYMHDLLNIILRVRFGQLISKEIFLIILISRVFSNNLVGVSRPGPWADE
jgi:hypothetical protein